MDVKKIAAEAKAKALADLKAAESMELAAEQIELVAQQFGWKVTIDADATEQKVAADSKESTPTQALPKAHEIPQKKRRGGKKPDPNSVSSRAKIEGPNIVRELMRPVPLGDMAIRLDQRGIKFGGKEPNQALSATLGKCPELRATPRGWWLKGVPMPREGAKVIGGGDRLPGLN
ncbi:MAG: hypothetical protein QOJ84_91 [Bradyrhizobium sp.]|jgi:hypothetical protein|nr:hypothetical protein [Bradyrhizobium sp.]